MDKQKFSLVHGGKKEDENKKNNINNNCRNQEEECSCEFCQLRSYVIGDLIKNVNAKIITFEKAIEGAFEIGVGLGYREMIMEDIEAKEDILKMLEDGLLEE